MCRCNNAGVGRSLSIISQVGYEQTRYHFQYKQTVATGRERDGNATTVTLNEHQVDNQHRRSLDTHHARFRKFTSSHGRRDQRQSLAAELHVS